MSYRCVLAKVGLDGHQRGVQVVAQAWRDAGYEVIYLGLRTTPATVARIAVQEDADVVGLSVLSGAHLHLVRRTREELDRLGAEAIPIVFGGVVPAEDVARLQAAGAAAVLRPGTTLKELVDVVPLVLRQLTQSDGQMGGAVRPPEGNE
jgi:methylmalonyl-CoA mutase C-terminal domain/subunit